MPQRENQITYDHEEAATGRALLVLQGEVGELTEIVERVRIQVCALASRYGIAPLKE